MSCGNSQKSVNQEELKRLCLRIEKWTDNWNINSQYLKDKIKECRCQTDKTIIS